MEDRPSLYDDGRKPEEVEPPVTPPEEPKEPDPIEIMVPSVRVKNRRSRPIRIPGQARKFRRFSELSKKHRDQGIRNRIKIGSGIVDEPETVIENPTIHTKSKRSCQFCFFDFERLLAICPRCGNCQDCGLYSDDPERQVCILCGNSIKNFKRLKRNRVRASGSKARIRRRKDRARERNM